MRDWTCCEMHSHSTVSDGVFEPKEMAKMMAEAGVELWSLTDHDHTGGCEEAMRWAQKEGVAFVPGIEISADWRGQSIHVLGYGYDLEDRELGEYAATMVEARRERIVKILAKLKEMGVELEMEAVDAVGGGGNLGRPHVAEAMAASGAVSTQQEAFDRYLDRSAPAYVAVSKPSVAECIEMIRRAGGMAVIAHPGHYEGIEGQWRHWVDAGLQGVEVRHPSHHPGEEEVFLAVAASYGLVRTASQDWHGRDKDGGGIKPLGQVEFPEAWRVELWEALEETATPPVG